MRTALREEAPWYGFKALVGAVDRSTHKRYPKESLRVLGSYAAG